MAIDWTPMFKKYKGRWVALKDDEVTVIVDAATAKSVLLKAKKQGYDKPILLKIPLKNLPFIGSS